MALKGSKEPAQAAINLNVGGERLQLGVLPSNTPEGLARQNLEALFGPQFTFTNFDLRVLGKTAGWSQEEVQTLAEASEAKFVVQEAYGHLEELVQKYNQARSKRPRSSLLRIGTALITGK